MIKINPHRLMVGISLLLLSCSGSGPKTSTNDACLPPAVDAGADQTAILGQPVVLDASGSEWCTSVDEEVVLTWAFVSVPTESAVNDNVLSANRSNAAISPQFIPDVTGEYVLSLTIDDTEALSSNADGPVIDYVVISIVPGDAQPTASCGPTGTYQGEIGLGVVLDGSASVDPENAALEYNWTLTGPSCSSLDTTSLYNEGTSAPSFVPDCEGTYIAALVVSDGGQLSEPSVCSVEVSGENQIPVADAGPAKSYGGCAINPLTLSGYGSYDPDGDTLTYSWDVVSLPTGSTSDISSFDDPTAGSPTFVWDLSGQYTFQLQVNDGNSWSAPDLVHVDIAELADNHRPIANAGDSMTIEASANCQNTSYSNECTDCPAYFVTLDGAGSMDIDYDRLDFEWTEPTGGLNITTPTSAVTQASIASQAPGTTLQFEVTLSTADCQQSDTDTMTIYYSCTSN